MTNYPYYIATFMDAGVLRKIFNDKKFKTHDEAVEATKKRYERFAKNWGKQNVFYTSQIVILEYIAEYQGRIVTLFTNGEELKIITPKVLKLKENT